MFKRRKYRFIFQYVVEPAREKLLPDPLPAGYLQPKYTIAIEMKNVLVHPEWTYKTGYRFAKRPALEYFLDVVGYPNFEVRNLSVCQIVKGHTIHFRVKNLQKISNENSKCVAYQNYFQVVIYTSESMMTGGPVVESFDPKQRIMYKLFRDCTKYMHGHHVKVRASRNFTFSPKIYFNNLI